MLHLIGDLLIDGLYFNRHGSCITVQARYKMVLVMIVISSFTPQRGRASSLKQRDVTQHQCR